MKSAAKDEAVRIAAQLMEAAQPRATEIAEAARRDQEEVARYREEARGQADCHIDEGKAAAEAVNPTIEDVGATSAASDSPDRSGSGEPE